jgi:chitinase
LKARKLTSSVGAPGPCTQSSGTLSYTEIEAIIASDNPQITFDPVAAVKIVVWSQDQWVSFDDAETFQLKVAYANSECIGGFDHALLLQNVCVRLRL